MARTPLMLALGAGLCLATITLVWLGYSASMAQQRGELLLAERRANETLALLLAALDRDMKGAQLSVLVPINREQLVVDGPADLAALASRAFARFPYTETFFVWGSRGPLDEVGYVFNRADRRPPWDTSGDGPVRYPVVTHRDHPALTPLIEHVRRDATHRKRFAAYELEIGGVAYQIVVHLLHGDVTGELDALIGYTVNVPWVRTQYFREIVRQVSRIGGDGQDMAISINDAAGNVIASTPASTVGGPTLVRHFSFRFFDGGVTKVGQDHQRAEQWTAHVTAANRGVQSGALSGKVMFYLMGLAALASIIGVVVIGRGLAVTSAVIAMKSDFVSTVTHELKTPLSLMHLVADSLATGRYRGQEKIPEYGQLLSAEVTRMTHLIDNLLSYARLTGVKDDYPLTPLDLAELLEEAAAICRPRLMQLGFTLDIEISNEPIMVLGNRIELMLALNNLLDNSIKYSYAASPRTIIVRGRLLGPTVTIEVEDRGSGIYEDELPLVFEKFVRGRDARVGGSGLGLAIVNRIAKSHGGSVEISSVVNHGTTVTVSLRAA